MIIVKEQHCPKNHRCPAQGLCPVGAIVQKDNFSAPTVDNEKCIDCGKCVKMCRTFSFK